MNQFICHPKCTTCQKARRWLDAHGIPYAERDIRTDRPTEPELRQWAEQAGLPACKLFSTSGIAYRSMGLSKKLNGMDEAQQFQLLASDGMLVKRPILVCAGRVLVGFREGEWAETLSGGGGA